MVLELTAVTEIDSIFPLSRRWTKRTLLAERDIVTARIKIVLVALGLHHG
jgi:hypothetical protein